MYSLVKYFVAYLLPVPLCLGVLLAGLIFLWCTKRQTTGKVIITIGVAILLLFSLSFFPNMCLRYLEHKHVSYIASQMKEDNFSDIKYVVVLAGGHILDPKIPVTSQFCYEGLVRLIEGIRLYKKCQKAKLVLSGGIGDRTDVTDAILMADLSIELGVPKKDIILEQESMSTFDEARLIKPIVRNQRFILVTSASHMPRSMALFRKLGMNPVPAPTGHLVKHFGDSISILPSVSNLKKSDTAFYEILGIIKEKVLGRI